jgi:hypothetical protein
MNDERQQDKAAEPSPTPGPEASPPEPLRPPEAPKSLWGIWWPEGAVWLSTTAGLNSRAIAAFEGRDEAEEQSQWNKSHGAFPALLGVSPAVVAQRDKLGEALAEAETAARNEIEWLQTIGATASPRYRLVEGRQRRWAALLAEWRAAQGREHEGSTADGQ